MNERNTIRTPAPARRILVACIGNIFFGDDGFGVAVARRLAGRRYPPGVAVVDFGIRGVELAYTLLDGYDTLVLVDAFPRGKPPGTLCLIEVSAPDGEAARGLSAGREGLDAHSMDPVKVLAFARALGAPPAYTVLIGCEPSAPLAGGDDEEMCMALSAPVQAAVAEAARMVDALVYELADAR